MQTNFHDLSAIELVAGLQARHWTSTEVTRHFLNRIKELNPSIHAVPYVFEQQALEQARQSDERRAAGKAQSRLDGLPMTLKDAIRVKDQPSTYGIWILRNYRPKTDSQLVRILRDAGVVFLGRTAVPTGALDWNCKNLIYPECVNPLDSSRTPGGSSGGAAAALATGMTPLELGSDLGGSIRYPAHCCGVYGLRTTDGWLPIEDVGPEGFKKAFHQLATSGPMARNLADLELILDLFVSEFPHQKKADLHPIQRKLKIAFSPDLLGTKAEPSTRKLLDLFLMRLSTQGHAVVESQPPVDFDELYKIWGVIAGFEYSSAIPAVVKYTFLKRLHIWWILDRRLGSGALTSHAKQGMFSSEKDYREACKRRLEVFEKVDRFFEEFDLWILPVAPSAAIPRSLSGKKIPSSYGPIEYSNYLGSYTVPTTVLGTPALACPIGFDDEKMPVGVQIHGSRFSDRLLVETVKNLFTQTDGTHS